MNTQIHRITPDNPPKFPCWLWIHDGFFSSQYETNKWYRPAEFQFNRAVFHATHYHPDAPTAPTQTPDDDMTLGSIAHPVTNPPALAQGGGE